MIEREAASGVFIRKKIRRMSRPKTPLDKVIHAIRNQPKYPHWVSKITILKYLKSELDYENHSAIRRALIKGVETSLLEQKGSSFRLRSEEPAVVPTVSQTEGEVVTDDITKGKGDCAEVGDSITIKYVGKLDDGTMFDAESSFGFTLGVGDSVIKGWDQGLLGMKPGGKRKLVIPPELGYRERNLAPDIPPGSTLHFEITLKKLIKASHKVKE
mmetsp:Transcript_14229/g.21707  ORF Transcript_14229/g.21707 Transcript_14229/m.21707 type:complete len:214 (+) Transcript_14229:140-781(+)